MLTICPATTADLPALHALVERAYRGDAARAGWTHEADLVDGERLAPGELAAELERSDQSRLLLAEAAGVVVGCVLVRRATATNAYLGLLTVEPARQGSGLGKHLLTAGEAAAADLGARVLEMTVVDCRPELIAWYERRGWRLTGERRPFPVAARMPIEFVVLDKAVAPPA